MATWTVQMVLVLFCFDFSLSLSLLLCSFWLLAALRCADRWLMTGAKGLGGNLGKRLVQCRAVQNRAIKSLKHQFPSVWFGPFFYLWQSFIMARVQGKFFAITLFHYPATLPAIPLLPVLQPPLAQFSWRGGCFSRHLNQSWVCILKARFVHLFYLPGTDAFLFIIPRLF